MIKTISITNYKSFHPTKQTIVEIDTSSNKPAIFYGLNGSGKTSIGEVIDGIGRHDPKFAHCSVGVTGGGPFRYLVYNHDFVNRVIGEPDGMPGIFTLGEMDTETQHKIDEAQRDLSILETTEGHITTQITGAEKQLEDQYEAAKSGVWQAHTKVAAGEPMKSWLQGYHRDKASFF